ncbi:hypothetical protein JG687_00018238 [Phytophthora cactorum]|uniref:Uncharacterized protein n=1 Tax=Phytophthora cactorum TaxID=29920 RepID=A0A329S0Y5_9STRA|nr:hypothetical protein GQ600_4221 [Phytophthora cactorum]KAG2776762.1 hypothetical protein Pcac1_g12914 [Phytophthora cactorum]KAG2794244.1 hypothetical protein PC111_g22685 [Phytophthora cactorum]KAG2818622.1 hypothetical protein PC113_g22838 [Phytophthora cactorum]KAG2873931.1 hypothetical protein PC114_g25578 [Phytophthora cactorum]
MWGEKLEKSAFIYINSSLLDDKDPTDYMSKEDSDDDNDESGGNAEEDEE